MQIAKRYTVREAYLKEFGLSDEEVKDLLNIYKNSDYNSNVHLIINCKRILEKRNVEQIKILLEKLRENLYKSSITAVILNTVDNRNFYEQICLIGLLKKYSYDRNVKDLIIDEDILANNSYDEQCQLIKQYITSNCDENVYDKIIQNQRYIMSLKRRKNN